MIDQLVVGIAVFGAEYASHPRVASRHTILLRFDAVRQTARNIPSGSEVHRTGGACGDTTADRARRAGVEADSDTWFIEYGVDQHCGAEGNPRPVNRVHHDAEDAGAGESGQFRPFPEIHGTP